MNLRRRTIEDYYGSLQYYRLIRKCMSAYWRIPEAELELMLNLYNLPRFDRHTFKQGEICCTFDYKRRPRLIERGALEQIPLESWGNKNQVWRVTYTWKRKIMQYYKIVFGDEIIPTVKWEERELSTKEKHLIKRARLYNAQKRKKDDFI